MCDYKMNPKKTKPKTKPKMRPQRLMASTLLELDKLRAWPGEPYYSIVDRIVKQIKALQLSKGNHLTPGPGGEPGSISQEAKA